MATALLERFADLAEEQPEIVAHHWTEAAAGDRAAPQWRKAGVRAAARYGNLEAISHLRRALDQLQTLPASPERERNELGCWLTLGPLLISTKGFSVSELDEVYDRARALARTVGTPSDLFMATWGLCMYRNFRCDPRAARNLAQELITIAEAQSDLDMRLQAHHAAWTSHELLGDNALCKRHADEGVRLYVSESHGDHAMHYGGHDPGVCAWSHRAMVLWRLGFPASALDAAEEAAALARTLPQPFTFVMSVAVLSQLHWYRGDHRKARRFAQEAMRLCRHHDSDSYLGPSSAILGWTKVAGEGNPAGIGEIRKGLDQVREIGPKPRIGECLTMLASAHLRFDQLGPAADAIEQAKAFLEASSVRRWEAEIVRLEGHVMQAKGASSCEACFQRALAIARAQEARSLELRAATSLARLWAEQGEGQKALDLLAPVYGWFTEGFDTADLKDAKALLAELT